MYMFVETTFCADMNEKLMHFQQYLTLTWFLHSGEL